MAEKTYTIGARFLLPVNFQINVFHGESLLQKYKNTYM